MPYDTTTKKDPGVYDPDQKTKDAIASLSERVTYLKDARKRPLVGTSMCIEDKWREADLELAPHELEFTSDERKRFETDDELGMRSRLVKVGEEDNWQSNVSSADFYVKVTTAVSILTDMNPEAVFLPSSRRYEKNTLVAYANWKKSWENSGARQQMKMFTFNLAKYGFAVGRTFPRIVEMKKKIWKFDSDKYEERRLVKYNDLARVNLNPWQVWVSDAARIADPLSVNDWYYETEYDEEVFRQEFPEADYPDAAYVKGGMVVNDNPDSVPRSKDNRNKITVGFYENQVTDKYCVWVPSARIMLSESPLPNDDGMLSLWFAPWTIRDDRSIYGIGIFEIIRNDKYLYDRLSNMTMDQLALSIYKMFFYKGVDRLGENGRLVVAPGRGEQSMDPQAITWMNVPGPGAEAWKGMEYQKAMVDDNSGVPMQLSGRFAGKTLGQDIAAKETALERLKTPLDFICDALQREAYVSLSWIKQIYSTPEMLEWNSKEDLAAALEEVGLAAEDIVAYLKEAERPATNGALLFQTPDEMDEETGTMTPGKKMANVYRETPMKVGIGDKGELFETEENQFYRFGVDFSLGRLDWKGVVSVKPQSILKPSKELSKRSDLDLFNLVFPSIQAMATNPMLVPVLMPPIKQIIKAYDKDPKEWLDQKYFEKLYADATQPKETMPEVKMSLSVAYKDLTFAANQSQKEVLDKYLGIKVEEPLFVSPGGSPQEAQAMPGGPGAPPSPEGGMNVNPKEGAQGISPVADLKPAPTTIGGAVEGATNMV